MTFDRFPLPASPRQRLAVGPASIGWGLLGASQRAQQFMIDAIRSQPPPADAPHTAGAWVVAVYSHHEPRAQQFAENNQLPHAFANLDDLLTHRFVHAVYVSSHPRHHFPLVMAALAADKHVLCEPPLGLTPDEIQTMQQAAADRGLLLAVNHQHRGDALLQHVRDALADRAIGDVLGGRISNIGYLRPQQKTWRLQPNGGGVILQRTLFDLDLLRFVFQDEIAAVTAISTQQILGESGSQRVEEEVLATVRLARLGVTIQLHDSFFVPHNPASLEIYGATGSLIVRHWFEDDQTTQLWLLRNQQAQAIAIDPGNRNWQVIHHFQIALRTGIAPFANADDSLRSLTAALAVQESIWTKRPVLLNP